MINLLRNFFNSIPDYSDKTVQFSDHISALAKSSDDQIEGNLVKFSEVFREIERSRGILVRSSTIIQFNSLFHNRSTNFQTIMKSS